jgi:hypothetical protein
VRAHILAQDIPCVQRSWDLHRSADAPAVTNFADTVVAAHGCYAAHNQRCVHLVAGQQYSEGTGLACCGAACRPLLELYSSLSLGA